MTWQYEADADRLRGLRAEASQMRQALIDAEMRLADQQAEFRDFEQLLELRLGGLTDELAQVEAELAHYHALIQRRRQRAVFEADYESADEQFRRTWQGPQQKQPPKPAKPVELSQVEMKRLYRQLARRYHPDLAADEADRAYRTEQMTAVNEAYAARRGDDLLALAEAAADIALPLPAEQTRQEMARALEAEIARCRLRIREIDSEINHLHLHPTVRLSLEVKLAQRQGRNLLAEMSADLARQIARKTAERDMIKAQFEQR